MWNDLILDKKLLIFVFQNISFAENNSKYFISCEKYQHSTISFCFGKLWKQIANFVHQWFFYFKKPEETKPMLKQQKEAKF